MKVLLVVVMAGDCSRCGQSTVNNKSALSVGLVEGVIDISWFLAQQSLLYNAYKIFSAACA